MIKLSVFTVATPELEPEQLAEAAAAAGLRGIEWRFAAVVPGCEREQPSFWGNNLCSIDPAASGEQLDRFKAAAESCGLKTISVTPYLQVGDIAALENVLRAAGRLGASFIRLAVPGYDRGERFDRLFAAGRAYLREAEGLCREHGVKGLIETHHATIAASASAAMRLADGRDPAHIGVLFDPGNMVHEGYENYRMGLELLGPYLDHVHVKNAGWRLKRPAGADGSAAEWESGWETMRGGAVPWRQVLEDLLSVGYDGYLGVEDFSREFTDSRLMLAEYAGYMNGLLRELGHAV